MPVDGKNVPNFVDILQSHIYKAGQNRLWNSGGEQGFAGFLKQGLGSVILIKNRGQPVHGCGIPCLTKFKIHGNSPFAEVNLEFEIRPSCYDYMAKQHLHE